MAKCFIEESGLPACVIRRTKGSDDFIGKITETFRRAKENAPAIVLLDDLDKFANEDDHHRDAAEYVAVQAGIDDVKGAEVFVLATVNDRRRLPDSLTRPGRFDRVFEVQYPTAEDAEKIIAHYLKDRKIGADLDMSDVVRMISHSSCAALESVLNDAAMSAAYARKACIEREDLVRAVLRREYDSPDDLTKMSSERIAKTALHEAGHLVANEVLCAGSVGLASIRSTGRSAAGGFVHRCKRLPRRAYCIVVALAGKAAVELYYSETVASGCQSDIKNAYTEIREAISESGTNGFGMIDVAMHRFPETSESMNARNEAVAQAELARYYLKAKDVLLQNRAFLEKAAAALAEKETLLYSDIQKLRAEVGVTAVAV